MTTEVESMFTKFLEGLKLSTAPLKVGDSTNKESDAIPDKGEASSEKAPSSSGKNGTGILPMWNHHLCMVDRFLQLI